MKKLINQVETVLNEQLQGFVVAHPALRLHRDPVFITWARKSLSSSPMTTSR